MTSQPAPRLQRLIPPAPASGLVTRPRLTERILATPARSSVVLTAPVGFGATTAAAQALAEATSVAWIGLDSVDSEPDRFLGQLRASIARGTGIEFDDAEWSEDSGIQLSRILERIGDTVEWIVLDGLSARAHSSISADVRRLCESLAGKTRLLITTHDALHALPLPAHSDRVRSLQSAELAVTGDEAAEIVLAAWPSAPADAIDEIISACEGWTSVCRGAAVHLVSHPDESAGLWLGGAGADLITSAALAELSDEEGEFLLATAVLDELSASLCDAVLERTDSALLLAEMEQHGSLLAPAFLDPALARHSGRWWKRHPMITAGLRRRSFGRDLTDAHRRAAAWFADAGDFDRTMTHLIAVGDHEQAGRYLSEHEDTLFETGRAHVAREMYGALADEAWGEKWLHRIRSAWGHALAGDVRGAEVIVARLRSQLAASAEFLESAPQALGEIMQLTAYLAFMRGDVDQLITAANSAWELQSDETPANSRQLTPLLLMAGLLWKSDVDGARQHLALLERESFPTDVMRESNLAGQRGRLLALAGEITRARYVISTARVWLESQNLDPIEISQYGVLIAGAIVDLEAGHAERASAALDTITRTALERGYVGHAVDAMRWQSRARMATGELAQALTDVRHARTILTEHAPGSSMARQLDIQEAWIRLLAGDLVRAERIVRSLPRSDEHTLLWSRITAMKQGGSTTRSLATATFTTPRLTAEQQVVLAIAAYPRSHRVAEGYLSKASEIAQAHGLELVFLGLPSELLDLGESLGLRVGDDGLVALVRKARVGFNSRTDRASVAAPAGSAPLSAGELHLLAFLPSRDTNAVIAEQLGISVNTVKTRLARLYRKLDVTSRDEAVTIARQRGLIA